MPTLVAIYLVVGLLVAAFSIFTFVKFYKEISSAELLFSLIMIPLWPVMAYYTVYNYLDMIEDNKKENP